VQGIGATPSQPWPGSPARNGGGANTAAPKGGTGLDINCKRGRSSDHQITTGPPRKVDVNCKHHRAQEGPDWTNELEMREIDVPKGGTGVEGDKL